MSIQDRLMPCPYPHCHGKVFRQNDGWHYVQQPEGYLVVQEHQAYPAEDDVDEEIEPYD